MSVAIRAAAAVAAAALAMPATAYVRTANEETHVPVSWPLPLVPYALSSAAFAPTDSCKPVAGRDPVEDAVRASFAAWQQPCADLSLVYAGRLAEMRTTGVGDNLVVVRNGWCSQDPIARVDPCMTDPDVDCGGIYNCYEDHGDWSTVALTTVVYDPNTGRVFDADMELNGWDGKGAGELLQPPTGQSAAHGYYFTCETGADRTPAWSACTTYGQTGCFAWDLQNTVTHEAGHFVGLAHPCERFAAGGVPACSSPLPPTETVPYSQRAMYPFTGIGDVAKRTLSPDDVAGVCAIYPQQGGGCGCGSGGGPEALAALLALVALRRRAR